LETFLDNDASVCASDYLINILKLQVIISSIC